jgi:hypothetical protein
MQIAASGKLEIVSLIQQKKVITCMQSYRGKLLSVQKSKQDFEIVIQTLKPNPSFLSTQEAAEDNFKFMVDQMANQTQP